MKPSYITFMLLILSLNTCQKNNIIGKYINTYDEKAINYLELKKDMTYYHYYEEDSILLSQKGRWMIDEDEKNTIILFDFQNYNDEGKNFKEYGTYLLMKNGNYLNNGYDGNSRGSFFKQ